MSRVYDTKRATLEVLSIYDAKPTSRDIFKHLNFFKKELARLKKNNVSRESSDFKLLRQNIQDTRRKLHIIKQQHYRFLVYVKQYDKSTEIEYSMPVREFGPDYRKTFKEMIKGVINQAIGTVRTQAKYEPSVQKFSGLPKLFHGNKKLGRVFTKDGEILKIYVARNIQSLYEDKVPKEPKKYIGIELEFCAPIKEQEFALKLFRSGIHKFAQLKKDGSLRPHEDKKEHGYELAILLEESNYKKRLKQITDLLSEVKAITKDRRAGLHVHLDMRRRNKDLVYNNLVACQYALLSVVDPQRYNNEFCRLVDSRKFPTEFTGQREERYKTINAAAFYKYKTLEVRMHEGSVDYIQISNWVDLLVRIANYPKKLKDGVAKITILNKRINMNKKLFNYLKDRSCFWQVQNNGNTRMMQDSLDDRSEVARLRDAILETQQRMSQPTTAAIFPSQTGYNPSSGSYQISFNTTPNGANPFLTSPPTSSNVGISSGLALEAQPWEDDVDNNEEE